MADHWSNFRYRHWSAFNALIGVIPCEYPDKLYLFGTTGLSYQLLKTTRSYLHSSGHNIGT